MAKPIAATPVARGEDARRIQEEMRSDRPFDSERLRANVEAVRVAKSTFRFDRRSANKAAER